MVSPNHSIPLRLQQLLGGALQILFHMLIHCGPASHQQQISWSDIFHYFAAVVSLRVVKSHKTCPKRQNRNSGLCEMCVWNMWCPSKVFTNLFCVCVLTPCQGKNHTQEVVAGCMQMLCECGRPLKIEMIRDRLRILRFRALLKWDIFLVLGW